MATATPLTMLMGALEVLRAIAPVCEPFVDDDESFMLVENFWTYSIAEIFGENRAALETSLYGRLSKFYTQRTPMPPVQKYWWRSIVRLLDFVCVQVVYQRTENSHIEQCLDMAINALTAARGPEYRKEAGAYVAEIYFQVILGADR